MSLGKAVLVCVVVLIVKRTSNIFLLATSTTAILLFDWSVVSIRKRNPPIGVLFNRVLQHKLQAYRMEDLSKRYFQKYMHQIPKQYWNIVNARREFAFTTFWAFQIVRTEDLHMVLPRKIYKTTRFSRMLGTNEHDISKKVC